MRGLELFSAEAVERLGLSTVDIAVAASQLPPAELTRLVAEGEVALHREDMQRFWAHGRALLSQFGHPGGGRRW